MLLSCTIHEGSRAQDTKQLKKAHSKGGAFLTGIQQKNGAIQDTSNSLFSVWETILATRALYELKQDIHDPTISKALQYLRQNENENGLICHNEKCREAYCIETTSEYFTLLAKIDPSRVLVNQLERIRTLQDPKGFWEIGNPDVTEQKKFPSVTAYVIKLSYELSFDLRFKEEAFSFLEQQQLPDGSWGKHWEYYNTPAYALWQGMKALGPEKKESHVFKNAKAFILSTQKEEGCWNFKDTTFLRGVSCELQTALIASCLLNESDAQSKKALSKAILFLLNHQQSNGSWDGGYFPINHPRYLKREYVFATAATMMLLENYLRKRQ